VAIIGAAGLGKTILLRAYLDRLHQQQVKVVYVFYSKISFPDLLEMIGQELGVTYTTPDPSVQLTQLQQALLAGYARSRQFVVVIDEAQNMPLQTLESLPALATLVTMAQEPLVQLVLAGLPEFRHTLHLHALRPLKRQLALCVALAPLTPKESLAYIRHRLAKVLTPEDAIFTAGALKRIIRFAKGNPRVLNALCANSLITGVVRQERHVCADMAQEVIAEFGKRSFTRLLRWGVVYAAAVLLVAGLALGVRTGHLQMARKAPLELSHFFWPLSDSVRKYQEEQLAQAIVTSTQRQQSHALPAMMADRQEPVPIVPSAPTVIGLEVPEALLPPGGAGAVQRAGATASPPQRVAAVQAPPVPVTPPEPVQKAPPVAKETPQNGTMPGAAVAPAAPPSVAAPSPSMARGKRVPAPATRELPTPEGTEPRTPRVAAVACRL
jgi:type II secretory pathway predicted ATPase ExeA